MGLAKTTDTSKGIGTADAFKNNGGSDGFKQSESGTSAAIERLKASDTNTGDTKAKPHYKPRDFDAEARGKVKCVMFEAALQSPALAGLQFNTIEEFLKLVEKAADAGVDYTWR